MPERRSRSRIPSQSNNSAWQRCAAHTGLFDFFGTLTQGGAPFGLLALGYFLGAPTALRNQSEARQEPRPNEVGVHRSVVSPTARCSAYCAWLNWATTAR